MRFISFDVGIKNLAYCVFEVGIQDNIIELIQILGKKKKQCKTKIAYTTQYIPTDISSIKVIEWNVIPIFETDCKAKTFSLQDIGERLFSILTEPCMANIDLVLIENQIGPKNIRMRCVQSIIMQTYMCSFGMKGDMKNRVQFISSSQKLDYFLEKKKRTYQERKKESIVLMNEFLETEWLSLWHTHFRKHKKKDDLADCFLQGYSWLLLEFGENSS